MKADVRHGFPMSFDADARYGTVRPFIGGDKVERMLVSLPGELNGKTGVLEWLIEPNGDINHRFFSIRPLGK
jgi:hypothetical protein